MNSVEVYSSMRGGRAGERARGRAGGRARRRALSAVHVPRAYEYDVPRAPAVGCCRSAGGWLSAVKLYTSGTGTVHAGIPCLFRHRTVGSYDAVTFLLFSIPAVVLPIFSLRWVS